MLSGYLLYFINKQATKLRFIPRKSKAVNGISQRTDRCCENGRDRAFRLLVFGCSLRLEIYTASYDDGCKERMNPKVKVMIL